jgi:hypothetical protein
MIGYMTARQTQANHYVAQKLIDYGEYRQEDFYVLLADLNRKTIQDIHEKFDD